MTKQQAKLYGQSVASDILRYGDFTTEEKNDANLFNEAFYEIADNRTQYAEFSIFAAEVNKSKKADILWDSYDAGLSEILDKYLEKMF